MSKLWVLPTERTLSSYVCSTCRSLKGVTAGADRVRNGILPTGNFHGPVDAEYRSYYKNAQCIISVIIIIIYYRFVYYYRYVRIIYQHDCVYACVRTCLCLCVRNSGLSGCVTSSKIILSLFSTKLIKGSKERYLLGQDKTSKFSG